MLGDAGARTKRELVEFKPFVGIGPRRYFDLFSTILSDGREIVRKIDGRTIQWRRGEAEIRIPLMPVSYIEREQLVLQELLPSSAGSED